MPTIGQFLLCALLLALDVVAQAATTMVDMQELTFSPVNVTIAVNDTVTWTNVSSTGHTSTSDTGVWDSGLIAPGATFSRQFATNGSFPYHCIPHGSPGAGMHGTIIVGTGTTTGTSTTGSGTTTGGYGGGGGGGGMCGIGGGGAALSLLIGGLAWRRRSSLGR